jgi:hypothetical protein
MRVAVNGKKEMSVRYRSLRLRVPTLLEEPEVRVAETAFNSCMYGPVKSR